MKTWKTYRFTYKDLRILFGRNEFTQEITTCRDDIEPEKMFDKWAMKRHPASSMIKLIKVEEVELNENHARYIR